MYGGCGLQENGRPDMCTSSLETAGGRTFTLIFSGRIVHSCPEWHGVNLVVHEACWGRPKPMQPSLLARLGMRCGTCGCGVIRRSSGVSKLQDLHPNACLLPKKKLVYIGSATPSNLLETKRLTSVDHPRSLPLSTYSRPTHEGYYYFLHLDGRLQRHRTFCPGPHSRPGNDPPMPALAETTCWGAERGNNGGTLYVLRTLDVLSELLPIASFVLIIQHTAVDHDAYPLAETF
jgi:hypothetical protein